MKMKRYILISCLLVILGACAVQQPPISTVTLIPTYVIGQNITLTGKIFVEFYDFPDFKQTPYLDHTVYTLHTEDMRIIKLLFAPTIDLKKHLGESITIKGRIANPMEQGPFRLVVEVISVQG
jgi:hypothetical protein